VLESVYKVGLFLGAIACWRWGENKWNEERYSLWN
jgi:hypothetical protein